MASSGDSARPYRAILFDLFGTLVFFRSAPLVSVQASGGAHPQLAAAVERELPGLALDVFVGAARAVTREIVEARRDTHEEVSSQNRFHRILLRLGVDDFPRAERICRAHMRGLADGVDMPEAHRDALRALSRRFRLGLVSNFDHAPTAHAILQRYGLGELLDPIVISDEFGWRKPRASIFAAALDAVGVDAAEALYVGDTPLEDVHGARAAGLDVAWVNPRGETFPEGLSRPTMVIAEVPDLVERLR